MSIQMQLHVNWRIKSEEYGKSNNCIISDEHCQYGYQIRKLHILQANIIPTIGYKLIDHGIMITRDVKHFTFAKEQNVDNLLAMRHCFRKIANPIKGIVNT